MLSYCRARHPRRSLAETPAAPGHPRAESTYPIRVHRRSELRDRCSRPCSHIVEHDTREGHLQRHLPHLGTLEQKVRIRFESTVGLSFEIAVVGHALKSPS